MSPPEPAALRVRPPAVAEQGPDLQLVRAFSGRPSPDDEVQVLHLRPLRDATRTALCGVRVVPVEVQVVGDELVLCLDCAQERRTLRATGVRAHAPTRAPHHAAHGAPRQAAGA